MKSTPATPIIPAERRETALLRALKKRFNRMRSMQARQAKGWSTTRIARLHRLGAEQVRALLQEYSLFAAEVSLRKRIHYQEVPGTLRPGDKARYQAYCRANRHYGGHGLDYQGTAAAATLGDPALRFMACEVYCWESKLWDKL